MSQTTSIPITEVEASQNQKEVTVNTAVQELVNALARRTSIAMSDANYTLDTSEGDEAYGNMALEFTGTLTSGRNIIVPAVNKLYLIRNNTSGSHALTVKTPSGTGIAVAVGASYSAVFCDGTNVIIAGSSVTLPIAESDVTNLTTDLAAKAPLASPGLTGSPTAPTQTAADNSTKIATTAYADGAVSSEATLRSNADALKAPLASPALTGSPTAPTQTAADNSTKIATTAYVDTPLALKAPLASPALTGNPTAPTQSAADNSTKIATTAYVDTPLALKAPLASPTFTGSPAAPTQSQGDNSTKLATTAYVDRKLQASSGKGGFWGPLGQGAPSLIAIASASPIGANNEVRVAQFVPNQDITVGRVTLNSQSGSTWDVGIYDAAGNKIASTGAVAFTTANTNVTKAFGTPVTLYAGQVYWFAYTSASSASNIYGWPSVNSNSLMNTGTSARMGTAANAASSGVLPSTLGAIANDTSKNLPAVFIEV